MKVTLQSESDLKTFEGTNNKDFKLNIGNGTAVGPMESVLMAAAGCSSIDIINILEKMRQPLKSIKVEVEAKRKDEIPRTFTDIHLHYILTGDLKEIKVQQAINSSLKKYCSVSLMLAEVADITSSYAIVKD